MKDNLGINFLNRNNYDMEQALDNFSNDLGELNEQEYSWLRSHGQDEWEEYLQFRYSFRYDANSERMTNFPIYMVIEPSSICNLKCSMCFQCDEVLRKNKSGVMELNLWKKAIDEARKKGCKALTIAGRGEPLINCNIVEMFDYLKGKFIEIKLNTNGILMSDDIIRSILRNDIMVVFSAEGSNEIEYSSIRIGGDFSKLVANVKRFKYIRQNEYPESLCTTRICGVAFESVDIKRYYDFWAPLVDEVAITEYEERKDTYHNKENMEQRRCARLWQRIYVWWDGSISPCDVDYLNKLNMGNINVDSIENIWNGEAFNRIRALHHGGGEKSDNSL